MAARVTPRCLPWSTCGMGLDKYAAHTYDWLQCIHRMLTPLTRGAATREARVSAAVTTWNRETRSLEQKNVAIQVHGLQKSYKKLQVLKGVDFDVVRGSIFALLGSNGAGKTTIVRILTTLLKPDDGTARVNGFDVLSQPGRGRESTR